MRFVLHDPRLWRSQHPADEVMLLGAHGMLASAAISSGHRELMPLFVTEAQAVETVTLVQTNPSPEFKTNPDLRPVVYRDSADIRTILNLARSGLVLALLLLASITANFYQYYRRPDRIVVDRSSGRVLAINDREYGATEAVELGPDRLTEADKKYIVAEFVQALYRVDPATRSKDIERALRMMVPDSALKFARYLKQEGILEKQQQESWQSVWTVQDISVDARDRYTVRVIGRQDLRRLEAGVPVEEPRQLNLSVRVMADPNGRADRNLRSGFIVSSIDYKEIQ